MEVVTDFGTRNGLTLCSSAEAHQAFKGSCPECRHGRFNPGPPSMTKRQRRERAHAQALIENEERRASGRVIPTQLALESRPGTQPQPQEVA